MIPLRPAGDAALYDEAYFARHCGALPMRRDIPERMAAAHVAAARIAEALRPQRVFDAGCAIGLLTEALWDQGIATLGRDISSYALTQVRADIQPFLTLGSITEPVEGTYDLMIAVDVLHHLEEQDALQALRHLAAAAPQLLFAVPSGEGNPLYHRTVRPLRWWLERLAENGFAPVPGFDASFIAPHALLAERSSTPVDPRVLVAFEALLRSRAEAQQSSATLTRTREELASTQAQLAQARASSEALRADGDRLRQVLHARDAQVQLLKQRLEEQASEIWRRNEIEMLIRQQKEALDAATLHRDLLLGSTSWRLTAPLRSMLASLSRLRRRPPSP